MNPYDVIRGKAKYSVVRGDCRDVLRSMAPASCSLLLTDVPYAVSQGEDLDIKIIGRKKMGRHFGEWDMAQDAASIRDLIRAAIAGAAQLVHGRGSAYVCTSDVVFGEVWASIAEHFTPAQFGTLTWCKTNPAPSVRKARWTSASELIAWGSRPGHRFDFPGHSQSLTWFTGPTVHHAHRSHPNEKPVWLWQRIISTTTKPGDIVLDPFCGTGSAGEAALRLGRRFIGVELGAEYFEKACRRLRAVQQVAA